MRERMRFTTFSIPNVPMIPTQHSINAVTLWGDDSRTNASCASGSMCSMPPAKKNPADTQLARESLRGSERQTKGTSPQPTMRQNIDRADSSRNAVPIGDGTGVPCAFENPSLDAGYGSFLVLFTAHHTAAHAWPLLTRGAAAVAAATAAAASAAAFRLPPTAAPLHPLSLI